MKRSGLQTPRSPIAHALRRSRKQSRRLAPSRTFPISWREPLRIGPKKPQKNLQIGEVSLNLLGAKIPPLMILHPALSFVHVFSSDMMLMEAIVLFNR